MSRLVRDQKVIVHGRQDGRIFENRLGIVWSPGNSDGARIKFYKDSGVFDFEWWCDGSLIRPLVTDQKKIEVD